MLKKLFFILLLLMPVGAISAEDGPPVAFEHKRQSAAVLVQPLRSGYDFFEQLTHQLQASTDNNKQIALDMCRLYLEGGEVAATSLSSHPMAATAVVVRENKVHDNRQKTIMLRAHVMAALVLINHGSMVENYLREFVEAGVKEAEALQEIFSYGVLRREGRVYPFKNKDFEAVLNTNIDPVIAWGARNLAELFTQAERHLARVDTVEGERIRRTELFIARLRVTFRQQFDITVNSNDPLLEDLGQQILTGHFDPTIFIAKLPFDERREDIIHFLQTNLLPDLTLLYWLTNVDLTNLGLRETPLSLCTLKGLIHLGLDGNDLEPEDKNFKALLKNGLSIDFRNNPRMMRAAVHRQVPKHSPEPLWEAEYHLPDGEDKDGSGVLPKSLADSPERKRGSATAAPVPTPSLPRGAPLSPASAVSLGSPKATPKRAETDSKREGPDATALGSPPLPPAIAASSAPKKSAKPSKEFETAKRVIVEFEAKNKEGFAKRGGTQRVLTRFFGAVPDIDADASGQRMGLTPKQQATKILHAFVGNEVDEKLAAEGMTYNQEKMENISLADAVALFIVTAELERSKTKEHLENLTRALNQIANGDGHKEHSAAEAWKIVSKLIQALTPAS